jgi:hypothetical protein|nr:MAG TPA: hypothetical protein [Caudoviricetes sp.]
MESRYKKNRGYTYGSMIVTQDDTTVSELTEGVFHEWNDKLEIMGVICDFYDYSWRFYPDGRLVLSDFLNEDSEWRGENDYGHFEYQSLDEMLLDWMDELEKNESEEKFDEEIEFIKRMKR